MTFTTISVLVPTRKRLPQLATLLASFASTVTTGAELVFRIDDDDPDSADLLRSTPWPVIVGPRLQGYRSLPIFFEELRHAARGDVLMCGNDDMVFRTVNWPALVLAEANQYPDGIFNLGVATHNETHYPFSIVSRAAVDRIGHLQDPRLYWGDVYLRDVMAAVGRARLLPSVRIDHAWMGHTPDQTFLEAQQGESRNWNAMYWALHRRCVSEAIEKVRAGIAVPQEVVHEWR